MSPKQQSRESKSKRQVIREQRQKQAQQQRLIIIGAIVVIALLLVGVVVWPSIQRNQNIAKITPHSYTTANGTTIGDPNAPVKIEIFEDFKCHACQTYTNSIEPRVINEIVLAKPVYYVFYQFPFLDDGSNTKDSDQAALAAECAAEQNKFWDFKDLLFKNMKPVSGEFSADNLKNYARIAGLDLDAYNACYTEKRYQDKIDQDLALGEGMGVSGTPTIYVNGVDVAPGRVPTFDEINALVEQALAGTLPQPTPATVATP